MKTLKYLFTLLLLLCSTVAFAQNFEVNGICYNILSETDKTVEVTYKGRSAFYNEYTGDVVIPESVIYNGEEYRVTNIGNDAFSFCGGLTSIEIGNSVTSIGNDAFRECYGLTSIEIPNSVTSIGSNAFNACGGLTSIEIGNSVTNIGNDAFSGCSGITSIEIPNSVTSLEYGAFSWCSGLTSITIPNSVTFIGDCAFEGCAGLTSIEIPNSVTSIGESAFAYCRGLTSIEIGNGVTFIGERAFKECTKLKSVYNYSNLTFTKGANSYGYVAYYADKVYNLSNGSIEGDFIFGKQNGVYTLLAYSGNATELTLPANYKGENYAIGADVFKGNTTITSITIPNSVTSIGEWAFNKCTGLTSITIPNSVTSIGNNAFSVCTGLTSITIPNSVTSIGRETFFGCSGLTSIVIPNSVTSIGLSAFSECSGLTSITIPNSVTSIGNNAFSNCSGLTSIEIPNSVTSIEYAAFSECSGLTSITIPNSVTSIGSFAFANCSGLTSVEIPNSVTSIGDRAFEYCSGLTSVEIGNSVTSIGQRAFEGCTKLKSVYNYSNLTFTKGANSYGYVAYYADKVYNAPNGSIEGDFILGKQNGVYTLLGYLGNATELTLPANYKGENYAIGADVFNGNTTITSITIPNSVTSIGKSAFYYCTGLTSIVIPNSVTSIGGWAFSGCNGLKEVHISDIAAWCGIDFGQAYANPLCYAENLYLNGELVTELVIPDGVKEIKNYTFSNCTGLTSVEIGNSVTSIGDFAFDRCTGLTSITIPNSVTFIGDYAFGGCTGITSIEIPNSVTNIGSSAFEGCDGLASVIIGNSVENIGSNAFAGINAIFDIAAETPPTVGSTLFHTEAVLAVPDAAVDAYKAAWSNYAAQIFGKSDVIVTVNVEAKDATSGIMERVGIDKMAYIAKLTVMGSINSYDIIQFRDKMPLLRELDLSEATVVASNKAFYNGNCTRDNDLGDYAFYNLSKLHYVKLPKNLVSVGNNLFDGCSSLRELEVSDSVQSIGTYAFNNCGSLKNIELPKVMTSIGSCAFCCCTSLVNIELPKVMTSIGSSAFYNCSFLKEIAIPAGVKRIEYDTFNGCSYLERVTLPDGLEYISGSAFGGCYNLKEIKLPPTVKTIGSDAFYNCSALEEIRIPSSVQSIAEGAFSGCSKLNKVYTYTVEPTAIQENTFSTFTTATLYVPSVSFSNYYWDDGWKRFLNLAEFNEPYEYFYVNNDYVLNDDTGYIEGADGENPDADINAGGGFIVEGEQGDDEEPNQSLGDVNVGSNGEGTSGSIIGDNNLHIDNLNIKINVKGGRWYFFAFPFDIKFDKIYMENGSDYVFRYYDGEERAKKGNGGWKDVNENHLKAARGYIFQCSANDVLVLNIKDVKFKKEDKYNELIAHVSENLKDASWNFTGNPYLSYYDLADMDYTAPVTVWDGSKYVAIRPGDDDYHFAPYEAFFVQKPENKENITFDGEEQMTKKQSDNKKERQAAARRARSVDSARQLVNLVLGNGTAEDRTRIVFNESQSLAYEISCDATKFETAGVPQLYTIGNDKVRYAINERPVDNGRVTLGYTAPTAGFYTIEAQRMDVEVYVKDFKTGTLHNLKDGAYSFGTDSGTFNDRFEILLKGTAPGTTGIDEVKGENGNVEGKIYDLQGRKINNAGKGIYIINGEKVAK